MYPCIIIFFGYLTHKKIKLIFEGLRKKHVFLLSQKYILATFLPTSASTADKLEDKLLLRGTKIMSRVLKVDNGPVVFECKCACVSRCGV